MSTDFKCAFFRRKNSLHNKIDALNKKVFRDYDLLKRPEMFNILCMFRFDQIKNQFGH